MNTLKFTIFTPIYNRKHTIHRVWESLLAQTNKNFEWLIIDDGSTDGIGDLLDSYAEKAPFPVRIFKQKNSGKHVAFNRAIEEAKGAFLIPADSDDSFTEHTVEFFEKSWDQYGADDISGIDVLCMDEAGTIIGDRFPDEGIGTHFETYFKHKVKGEKWGCIRIEALRMFSFPAIEGAKFYPESYLWTQIGLNYKKVYLNEPLRIYFQDAGNQLMKTTHKSKGAIEVSNHYAVWWINTILPHVKGYLPLKERISNFFSVWKSSFLLQHSAGKVISKFNRTADKLFMLLIYIPCLLLFKVIKPSKIEN